MPISRSTLSAATRLVAAALALAAASAAHAVAPLVQHDVVLLQKGEIIEQRVDGGADAMAAYLKTLGEAEIETMRANPAQIPAAGFIVVAVRPGNQTRTWFDFPLLLNDDRIAKVVFQKSAEGQTMLEKAFDAWK